MWREVLLIAFIVVGVVSIPLLFFGLNAWLDRRRDGLLTGRQLVMEGELRMIAHGDIVSLGGRRPIIYPVTCVYFSDGRSCIIFDTMLVRFPPGTRVAVWRDRSDDRHYVERSSEE
jgi:hypothetical protein